MEYTLHLQNKTPIVHILMDDLIHDELKDYPQYVSKLRKIKEVSLHNCAISSIFSSTDSESVLDFKSLSKISDMGYEYACIWPDGSVLEDSDFDDAVIQWGRDQGDDWLVAGHIINREGEFPYLHEQLVIVNMNSYRKVCNEQSNSGGFRLFDDHGLKIRLLPNYNASEENIHDDYTPLELSPKRGRCHDNYQGRVFQKPVYESLRRRYRVLNIPHHIRKMKDYFYPEDDARETNEWINDTTMFERMSIQARHGWKKQVPEDKRELANLKVMTDHNVFFTNTESVPTKEENDGLVQAQLQTFVLPCSGLHQFAWLCLSQPTIEHVIFYDVNPHSIAWLKHLINTWDGYSDVGKIIEDYIEENFDPARYISPHYEPHLKDEFLEEFTPEDLSNTLNTLRNLGDKLEFVLCDVTNSSHIITDRLENNKNVFLNLTNILQYESNYLNNDPFDVAVEFYKLMQQIRNKSNTLYFYGNTPSNTFYCAEDITIGVK